MRLPSPRLLHRLEALLQELAGLDPGAETDDDEPIPATHPMRLLLVVLPKRPADLLRREPRPTRGEGHEGGEPTGDDETDDDTEER